MMSNDQDNKLTTGIEWSFDIWGEIPDNKGNPNKHVVYFSPHNIETTMPTIDAPKSLKPTADLCTTSFETNNELDLDDNPDRNIFKNQEESQC